MANTNAEAAAESNKEKTNDRHKTAPRRRLENQGAHLPGERRVKACRVVPRRRLPLPPAAQEETDRRKCGNYL